jgi:hypothetical protein
MRINNLPPVISSSDLQSSYIKHKDGVKIARRFHKLNPLTPLVKPANRFSTYTDILNDLTNNQFEKSKSMIQFPIIEERIYKNTLLCVFHIQQLKVFNDYDLNNPKVEESCLILLRFHPSSVGKSSTEVRASA